MVQASGSTESTVVSDKGLLVTKRPKKNPFFFWGGGVGVLIICSIIYPQKTLNPILIIKAPTLEPETGVI